MQNRLEQKWQALWQRLGAQGKMGVVFNELVARYSESHRAYHTLQHVEHCLDDFEQVRHLAENPDAVELALWYHDVIYETQAKDSEERSAELAVEMVKNALLPGSFGQLVANLVMATKHSATPVDFDAQLLVDIDLSVFGQTADRFNEYERQIRMEYWWVPEDAFVAGRSAILKSFFGRPNIYATQIFRDKYEVKARANIAQSLVRLRV